MKIKRTLLIRSIIFYVLFDLFLIKCSSAYAQFAGGSGSSGDPYRITNTTQLTYLQTTLNGGTNYNGMYFKLTDNLSLSGAWTPIGTSSKPFKGNFDGNGMKITGLYINSPSTDCVGLFGYMSGGGTIKNLRVETSSLGVTAGSSVGVLLGYQDGGTVSNCYVSGFLSAKDYAGGMIGQQKASSNSIVDQCYAFVDVTSLLNLNGVGGLIGCSRGKVTNSYATGNILGVSSVGGLVGLASNDAVMATSYAAGKIRTTNSDTPIGGICGKQTQSTSSVENNFVINRFIINDLGGSYTRRLVGMPHSNGKISNNYASEEVKVQKNGQLFTDFKNDQNGYDGYTQDAGSLKNMSFYSNTIKWTSIANNDSPVSAWNIWEGNSYPYLQTQSCPVTITNVSDETYSGPFRSDVTMDSIVLYKRVGSSILPIGKVTVNNTTHTWSYNVNKIIPLSNEPFIISYQNGKSWPSYPVYISLPCHPLNGTYTVKSDGSGDFTTLSELADQYNTCGLSGNTIIKIASDITETDVVKFLGSAPNADKYTLTITSDGQQRTVSGAVSGNLILFSDVQNITVDGGVPADSVQIKGGINNTKLIFQNTYTSGTNNTLHVIEAKNLKIKNTTFKATSGRGIYVESITDINPTEISGCYVTLCDAGIYAWNCKNLKIADNVLLGITRIPIYFLVDNGSQVNCEIINNTAKVQGTGIQTTMYGIYCNTATSTGNILIDGNVINGLSNAGTTTSSPLYGCIIKFSGNATIINNKILNLIDNNLNYSGGALYGIYAELYNSAKLNVNNCQVQNLKGSFEVAGIYVQKRNPNASYAINNCRIDNIHTDSQNELVSVSTSTIGIRVDGSGSINANSISNVDNNNGLTTSFSAGIFTQIKNAGQDLGVAYVTNNMVGFTTPSNNSMYGIYADVSLNNQNIFHNTISLSNGVSGNNLIANIYFTSNSSGNLQIKNNLLVNQTNNSPASYLYSTPSALNGGIAFSDNRYLNTTSKFAKVSGSSYTQLSDWNLLLNSYGGDNSTIINSINFVSDVDLHLSGVSATDNKLYVPLLKNVYQDYDNEYRLSCSNSAGADTYASTSVVKVDIPLDCELSERAIFVTLDSFSASYTYSIDDSDTFNAVNSIEKKSTGDSILIITKISNGNHVLALKNNDNCEIRIPIILNSYPYPTIEVSDLPICLEVENVDLTKAIVKRPGYKEEVVEFSLSSDFTSVIENPENYVVSGGQTIYARAMGYEEGGCPSAIKAFSIKMGIVSRDDYAFVPSNSKNNLIDVVANDLLSCCSILDIDISLSDGLTASHGTVSVNGNKISYTPDINWAGVDSLSYIAKCGFLQDTAIVYILTAGPAAGKHYACPNVVDMLKLIDSPNISYNWYDTKDGNSPVSKGVNTNYLEVVKNNDFLQTWWVEAKSGNIVFPRFAVEFYLSESCGNTESVDCVANGTLLFREDFGGNKIEDPKISPVGIPNGRTNYTFVDDPKFYEDPNRGMYTEKYCLVKYGPGSHKEWYNYEDHTYPNDTTRGYFMAVDASTRDGKFYTHTISDLCPGTSLYFSVWIGNLMKKINSWEYNPSLRFVLTDTVTNVVLAEYSTGEILNTSTPLWKQYGFAFTSYSQSVRLEIFNNCLELSGNDLVLDDIEIHACIPPVIVTGPLTYCPNDLLDLTVKNNDDTNLGGNQFVSWLFSEDGDMGPDAVWDVIPNFTSKYMNLPITKSGYLRAVVGSQGAIDNNLFNCCSISDPTHVTLTPELMYWRRNALDNDWNNPLNWVDKNDVALNAVPNKCTDVHIPGNARYYPSLDDSYTKRTENYGEPRCRDITYHFGSEVAKPNYLDYRKAYVQYNFGFYDDANKYISNWETHSAKPMTRGRWYALAAPLKKIVSGDFSVGGFPNLWQQGFKTAIDRTGTINGDWYTPENTGTIEVGAKENYAISVWAGEYLPGVLGEKDHKNLNALNGILEMPYFENQSVSDLHRVHSYSKADSTSKFYYYYYDRENLPVSTKFVTFQRGQESYRFIFEDSNNKPIEDFTMSVPGGKDIMIGNPFISTFNFRDFYNKNKDVIEDYYRLFDNNNFVTYSLSSGEVAPGLTDSIASFQGFFIKTKGTGNVVLHFPTSSSVTRIHRAHQFRSAVQSAEKLQINLSNENGDSWNTLLLNEDGNNVKSGNDVSQLFINNADSKNVPQLYLLNANKEKNVIQFENRQDIPLGIICESKDSMKISVKIPEDINCESLKLIDTRLNKEINLFEQNTYSFKNEPVSGERFILRVGNISEETSGINDVENNRWLFITSKEHNLEVRSSDEISEIEIINIQGIRNQLWKNINTNYFTNPIQYSSGVYIVRVKLRNNEIRTQKIVIE